MQPMHRRAAWGLGVILLITAAVTATRSPLVWRDEMSFAPMAYSLLHDGSGLPTVLAEDPRRPAASLLFYGPLFFWISAASFKIFGFSVASFRLVAWVFGVLLALTAAFLVRTLGGSRNWIAATWLLVILTPEFGSNITNGRMDTLAIWLQLLGLACLARSYQTIFETSDATKIAKASWAWAFGAGLAWAGAALTTPRSLPFFACLSVAALAWLVLQPSTGQQFIKRFSLAGGLTALSVGVWLATQGETFLSWLAHLNAIGRDNRKYALIGGFTQIRPTVLWVLTPMLAVVLLAIGSRGRALGRRETWRKIPLVAWLGASLAANALFTFILTARPESYPLYWGLPLLVATLAILAAFPATPTFAPASQPTQPTWTARAVPFMLVLAACLYGALRAGKMAEVAATWRTRDPQTIEDFARQNISASARVIGPLDYYFYAVTKANATYLFHEPLYDRLMPAFENEPNPLYPAARARQYTGNFLLWPSDKPLPNSCGCTEKDRIAHYEPPANPVWLRRLATGKTGYPAADLYRIK